MLHVVLLECVESLSETVMLLLHLRLVTHYSIRAG